MPMVYGFVLRKSAHCRWFWTNWVKFNKITPKAGIRYRLLKFPRHCPICPHTFMVYNMSNEQYLSLAQHPQRLNALQAYDLLDTPAEPDFDAWLGLLSHSVRAPLAWFGLIGPDSVSLKAQMGLEGRELPGDDWLCVQLLTRPREHIWVEDLAAEARWAQHPWATAMPNAQCLALMPVVDSAGMVLGLVGLADTVPRAQHDVVLQQLGLATTVVLSVMESRRRAGQLTRLAMTDPLTGIGNKAQFDLALQVEMGQAMRSGSPFTVLCMDLDGFKAVNDGFGHAAGDEVLCEVARRLRQQVRLGDTLVRLRDDEFAVVMRHGAEDAAEVLSKRIAKAIAEPIELTTGDTVGVGISIGMAAYHDMIGSGAELVDEANLALTQTKRRNEKRWHMFLGGGRRLF